MYTARWGPRTWSSVVKNGSDPAPNGPRNGNGRERQGNMRPVNGIGNGSVRQGNGRGNQPPDQPDAQQEGIDLKKLAENKKAFYQMRLDLEGKRKNLGKGNILTFLINNNNEGIEKSDVNKMLRCGGFQPAQVKGITLNDYRSNQVEVLFNDDLIIDTKEVEDKIKRDAKMEVFVSRFEHVEEFLMLYGLPLSNDMNSLKGQIEETLKPFIKKILDLVPTTHSDSESEDFFKNNFDGNWRVKVVPRNGKQIPNYIVVGETAKVMVKAVYTKKVGEKNEMCQDCFSTDHFKKAPECPGPIKWSKYCENFRDYWAACSVENNDEDRDDFQGGNPEETRLSSLNKELVRELEEKEGLEEKVRELEEENINLREQLEDKNKTVYEMEEHLNDVDNLQRRMSVTVLGKDVGTPDDAHIEDNWENGLDIHMTGAGSLGTPNPGIVESNDKKRTLESPGEQSKNKKTGHLPEPGKKIWVENSDGIKTVFQVHSKKNSTVNLVNDDKLKVSKNLKEVAWGYIDQDEVFE